MPPLDSVRPVHYPTLWEEEIEWLVSEGILEPVEYAYWAAPVIAVLKSDQKSVRLCGDFQMTVNPVAKLHKYPIPKVEDL